MMTDSELVNFLYKQFCENAELMKLLGSPKTAKARQEKIRRGITPLSYVTEDKVNFISIHYSSFTETENIYVIRGFLHIEYFTRNREDLDKIRVIVKEIMLKNDLICGSSYDVASDIKGVIQYTDKFRPLCFA